MEVPDVSKIPAKTAVVGLLGATTLAGFLTYINPKLAMIVVLGTLLMGLAGAKFIWIRGIIRKRRAKSMANELNQQSASTPTAISDRPQVEKLDGLRKNFQGGLDKFKAAGKDIYKLPWYAVVGEPGAGKTEVIRHCDVGFPPGMQEEEFQGVGGTINMNWWFTNRAVILDTAGRLLFEKVPAGSTGEWKEFLKLLRKHRPNCPINGLLLAIPADSLVKDPAKKIEERAGWIARQLDTIQRELDIRFPVYVIITKCDLLNGFREFFEHLDDPEAQRQMLGWSNPEAIDQPFQPQLVEQHMHMVVARLREIRFGMLEDPVARDASGRRVDEVDRPYSFPHSISLIAENLRRYLSTIFIAGEWSAKPLFLRGIYFTSSLQEGSELDQELAQAIGMSVDELPAGGAWKRETTLFLRDLFLEKIFPEWGLVTRATDTRRLMRRRLLAVLGTASLALAAVGLFTWLGYKQMQDSIGRQSGYWLRASEGWSADNTWMPIVSDTGGKYTYHGDTPVGRGTRPNTQQLFSGADNTLVKFHFELRKLSEEPLQISPIFRPFYRLGSNFDAERKRAQRIVLEGSVIKPLVDAARKKIVAVEAGAPSPDADNESEALISLIKIEAGIVKRNNGMPNIAPATVVMAPIFAYAAGEQSEYNAIMPDVINWTYSSGNGQGKWPDNWMNGGSTLKKESQSDKVTYNQAIDEGLNHYLKNCSDKFASLRKQLEFIQEFVDFLQKDYEKKETELWRAATTNRATIPQDDVFLRTPYDIFVEKDVLEVASKLVRAEQWKLFPQGRASLLLAYQRIGADWKKQGDQLTISIDELITDLVVAETKGTGGSPLLKEIRERLEAIKKQVRPEGVLKLDEEVLKKLDLTYLMGPGAKRNACQERSDIYKICIVTAQKDAPPGPWIGTQFRAIEGVTATIKQMALAVDAYQGESSTEFRGLCGYWLEMARQRQIDKCWDAYLKEARAKIGPRLLFPLVWPPADTVLSDKGVLEAADWITKISADLKSKVFTENQTGSKARTALEHFGASMAPLKGQLDSLLIGPNKFNSFSVTKLPTGNRPVLNPAEDLQFELRDGTSTGAVHGGLGRTVPLGGLAEVQLTDGKRPKLPVFQVFHAHWIRPKMPKKDEIRLGENWCVLRILNEKKVTASSADKMSWTVDLAEPGGVFPFDLSIELRFDFDKPILPAAAWPKKEMFNLSE